MTAQTSDVAPKGRAGLFARLIAALTGATAIGGAVLYLAGNVSYSNRLSDLGVPAGMFPQGVEATMVAGYYALVGRWTLVLVSGKFWSVISIALLFCAIAFAAYRYGESRQDSASGEASSDRALSWPLKAGIDVANAVVFIGAALYVCSLLTLAVLAPGLMGEKQGRESAREILACVEANAAHARARTELRKNGYLVARGFVMAASGDHVALFDIDAGVVRTMDRAGLEMHSLPFNRPVDDTKSSRDAVAPTACW